MRLKAKILLSLLKYNKLTTSQVADCCGYEGKPNKHGIVDESLKDLKRDGYIISLGKLKQSTGRPPTCYSVKEDLEVVIKIYKDFPELHEELRRKEWVLDLILGKMSDIEDDEVKEIRMMLNHSPNLFKLCLENPSVDEIAYLYRRYIKTPYMVDITMDDLGKNLGNGKLHISRSFHELFTFCVFLDYLEDKATNESFDFLRQVRENLQNEDMENQKFIISGEVMRTLKAISGLVRSNDWASMELLIQRVEEYQRNLDTYLKLVKQGEEHPKLQQELYKMYDTIAGTLGLMTFLLYDPLENLKLGE